MNQCLRCNQLCSTASVFCDNCLSLLQTQKQQSEYATVPLVLSPSEPQEWQLYESQDTAEGVVTITSPTLKWPQAAVPFAYGGSSNFVEQALNRLNEAARRIATVEKRA